MRISVVGGGYVGLVSAACFAQLGHSVDLIEIDEGKVEAINAGKPPIYEKGLGELLSKHVGVSLCAGAGYHRVWDTDISFICVGTPPGPDGSADLSMVEEASRSLGESLQEGGGYHVIVVKSTVPPGTTERLVMPTVIRHSGGAGERIGFAMNPEFLREGLAVQDFMNPDRIVVGSSDPKAGDIVESVYAGLNAPVLRVGLSAAEMIKYASNAMLATKISFSNEMGNICKRLGVDVYEVMKGVGMDHRISPHFLNAGAGFGGSCFPKDVTAMIRLGERLGEDPVLLKSVIEVNERQPLRLVELMEKRTGPLAGREVAVLGLAFKNDTDDVRDSRAVPVIEELLRRGARVRAYDPLAAANMQRIVPDIEYCDNAAGALRGADGCLIMTEWPEFSRLDEEFGLMRSRVIIEGRKILSCEGAEGICW
ncbi:UDP-glucose/GDP-mannose dehydrogenase family protein [Methanotrichaceae archaeon M04Ac]|uniref:UDP-glucose 6-dehydrogenase n=1 Tax=Candidatus Methanocrinis alkalitolerans TaxID=3033395 RepID=A0ABT5XGD6_9EURY|nr:UDP-glucose/GDP-mannose dehydrogenase family protein [Candidatus Methanocrinis alkalitolerans]MDF0593756.1 UDP-glucose/GDP-mannose dehydrogenase family protein [Candidatus Methanocrinis alkalitolerans]